MGNENMKGHWIGIFTETAEGTVIDFMRRSYCKEPFYETASRIIFKKTSKNLCK